MKRMVALYALALLSSFLPAARAQEIKLVTVYRKTISADYTRYEYVFSTTNHTRHRLNLSADVSLLDAKNDPLDTRFIFFEARPGDSQTSSIESDVAPTSAPGGAPAQGACFYRLNVRDHAHSRSYEKGGVVAGVAVVHKQR